MLRTTHEAGVKRVRQQQQQQLGSGLAHTSKKQRFWPCPVCHRSYALFRLDEHVNQCLDTPQSPSPLEPSGNGASVTHPHLHLREGDVASSVTGDVLPNAMPALPASSDRQSVASAEFRLPQSAFLISSSEVPSRLYAMETREAIVEPACFRLPGSLSGVGESVHSSAGAQCRDPSCPTEGCLAVEVCKLPLADATGAAHPNHDTRFLGNACRDVERREPLGHPRSKSPSLQPGEMARIEAEKDGGLEGEEMRDETGRALDRPPAGFQLFQRQVQSQARLSMFSNFSSSGPLQRKPTVSVLQPGMVLFRSWLDLETQQKLVHESHSVAHLFHRPTTSGGGKYHIYSMCWGPKWDAKAHRYVPKGPEQLLPAWMFQLSKKLARDAQHHTSVYPADSTYAPDVGLVNFYPVKADELGVIGLGGHQDLDDSSMMPVVSVSVGDSMTFFYRRLPPLSRRKSGVSISVDEKAARSCADGDAAHNREHQIVLESGDVLVFGGQSRLVFHGTRLVQPGTRPPGLHMVPGRLNFTFRQTAS